MRVRTRFAPSPTGRLHLGNARTALFNALFAAKVGGAFVLRIEDTDAGRSRTAHVDALIEDLRWLDLAWTEGPDIGGKFGPYYQSRRQDRYREALERLLGEGHVYPCFCTPEQLAGERERQLAAGHPPRYSGCCARLGKGTARRRINAGEPHALRFRVPPGRRIEYEDLIRGRHTVTTDSMGDFIIRRADSSPAFLFANALDDADMEISHVLRGADHVSNTPRQLLVLEALEREPPTYGHLSLIVGAQGRPLSKRGAAASLVFLRERGILPEALMNYLARLGYSAELGGLAGFDELAGNFDVTRMALSPAHDDDAQLDHWQRLAVRGLSADRAWDWGGVSAVPRDRWPALWDLVRDNSRRPEDLRAWAEVLGAPQAMLEPARVEIGTAPAGLFHATGNCTDCEDFGRVLERVRTATGLGGRRLFKPLRAALSGRLDGPELARLWAYFTPRERAARLDYAACLAIRDNA